VDALIEENKQLREVVRQLAANAGIDFANPKRGINTGATPSVKNPVAQKLSSLADVGTYNVLDGQVLGWSQAGQQWLPIEPPQSGIAWELATEEEHLYGDLDNDSDYYGTQVIGKRDPYPPGVDYTTGGTGDGYGLVGTSTSSAFLHGAQRFWGGPTRAHGYVVAEPYYCKMGNVWINEETGNWEQWCEVGLDRDRLYLQTPMGGLTDDGTPARDGSVAIKTNWFYAPQVNGVMDSYWHINYPKRPVADGYTPMAGAHVYDMTLKKPIWWNGTAWVDAMGNDIPAPLY
jgi:hypothetical protein